jgi:uncharacterized protein (DUF1499 family)
MTAASSFMTDYSTAIVAPSARWSCRLALFSVSLLLVSLVLHRATSFPTPVALNLFLAGFAGAALALLVGLVALVQIWRTGFGGIGSMLLGIILPLLAFAAPVAYALTHKDLPHINDVTTDVESPPRFAALAKRPDGANASDYPGARVAELQARGYPDLRPLIVERAPEETFELVEEAVRRLRWHVVAAEPPSSRVSKPGVLEATDQTLLVGFTDDVVVRVEGSRGRSRVDVRSASRYGRFDFGQNATRVRRFLAEVQARAQATVPGQGGIAGSRARALLKRQKAGDPQKAGSRTGRDRDRSDAPRAPGQKERPR